MSDDVMGFGLAPVKREGTLADSDPTNPVPPSKRVQIAPREPTSDELIALLDEFDATAERGHWVEMPANIWSSLRKLIDRDPAHHKGKPG